MAAFHFPVKRASLANLHRISTRVLIYPCNIQTRFMLPLQYGIHIFTSGHLDKPETYARILFVDFSSAFNTIIPDILQNELSKLSVPTSICQWITSTRTISTGAPQGCILSPLLFSLYTNDCTSKNSSVKLLKFADDTTVMGLIQDGDKSAYRQEVEQLSVWSSHNNLKLNTHKTVEMTMDFRRNTPALPLSPS
ncbi:hypothetical protein H4Q32_028647 [Labeo rohita]|uniref:Reverse transcriptase domain-containing protein n=1 Tax=Labeo rohita TaxID=84645 RepID=A0ABQ8L416_LABRO|nr:hypothetical protein H4Q32_028647 [Labeo rohita]